MAEGVQEIGIGDQSTEHALVVAKEKKGLAAGYSDGGTRGAAGREPMEIPHLESREGHTLVVENVETLEEQGNTVGCEADFATRGFRKVL